MKSERKKGCAKEKVINKLNKISDLTARDCDNYSFETVDGESGSIVVLVNAVGKMPITIAMNGREVIADMVLFTMAKEVDA